MRQAIVILHPISIQPGSLRFFTCALQPVGYPFVGRPDSEYIQLREFGQILIGGSAAHKLQDEGWIAFHAL